MMKSSVLQGGMKPTLARCFDQRDGMQGPVASAGHSIAVWGSILSENNS